MGFTVEDMMIVSQDRYRMELIAGRNGWSNSISWLLMLEDLTIIRNFTGKELAVTTGLGFQSEEKLLELLRELHTHYASGLIINTGFYIREVPASAIAFCDENDLPLLTVPWDVILAEMIKDLSIRIFLQGSTDEQISAALIAAIEQPEAQDRYLQNLLPHFDVDGDFRVVLLHSPGLDSMDTVERKRIGYRIQLYLSNITHNGHFFYYDSLFVLIINDVPFEALQDIVSRFRRNLKKRMPSNRFTVGIGSSVKDIRHLRIAYQRAKSALAYALDSKESVFYFDEMGIWRLLYSITDRSLLREYADGLLAPLSGYDALHDSQYMQTLELYLRSGGSLQAVADALYTHRNTIHYRMNNIRRLLDCPLETQDEKMAYLLACMIRHIQTNPEGSVS